MAVISPHKQRSTRTSPNVTPWSVTLFNPDLLTIICTFSSRVSSSAHSLRMPRVDNLPFYQPLNADFTHPSPHVVSAYKICYLAEGVVNPIENPLSYFAQDEAMKLKLINIRILGHLLSQSGFLSDRAISEIARSIISCRGDPAGTDETDAEALNMLGEFYMNNLLRPRECQLASAGLTRSGCLTRPWMSFQGPTTPISRLGSVVSFLRRIHAPF